MPDPLAESPDETTSLVEEHALNSQEIPASGPEAPEVDGFRKPGATRGINAELRTMIRSLQGQLEQQRQEGKNRERVLNAQLEQQRKDSEQQRTELMKLLSQQGEQLKQPLARQWARI